MQVGELFAQLKLDTSDYDKGLDDAKTRGSGAAEGIGLNAKTLIAGGLAAGGAAIAAGAVGSILETEGAVDQMAAKLGLTEEDAKSLGSVAKDVFRNNFGDSLSGVTEDITTIRSTLGEMTDQELKDFAEGALTIEDLWGEPTEAIAQTVKTMTGNFDDLSKSQALDLITTGFQNGGDFSGELLDTLNEYAPAFSNMGLSADEALGVLLAGAEDGAFNLDKVGDAMKEFEIRAQDGSDTSREAFEALGLDADEMAQAIAGGGEEGKAAFATILAGLSQIEDPVERNKQGVALFGTQWEDLGEGVVLAMAEGSKGIGEFEGATKQAADTAYDNLSSSFSQIKREAMGAFTDAITPMVVEAAEFAKTTLIPAVRQFGDILKENKPVVMAVGIAITATLVPALIAAAAAAWAALAPVLIAAAPLLAIAAAAAALGFAWQENFFGIRDITDDVIGFILPLIEGAWEAIKVVTEEVVGLVSDLIAGDWAGAWNRAGEWVTAAKDAITGALPAIWDAIQGFITETIPELATELAKLGLEFVAWVAPQIGPLLGELGALLTDLKMWILTTAIPETFDTLTGLAKEFVTWVAPQIPPLLLELGKLLASVTEWLLLTALPMLVGKLAEWGKAFIGWVAKDALPFIVTELWKLHKAIVEWIVNDAAPALLSSAGDIGRAVVEGIWSGIDGATDWLVGKLTGWVDDAIPGPIKDALELFSPSRVAMGIGEQFGRGMALGIAGTGDLVRSASAGLAGAAVGGVRVPSPMMSAPAAAGSRGGLNMSPLLDRLDGLARSGGGSVTIVNEIGGREVERYIIDTVDGSVRRRTG